MNTKKTKCLFLVIFFSIIIRGQEAWGLADCIAYGRNHSQLAAERSILKRSLVKQRKQLSFAGTPIVSGIFNSNFSDGSFSMDNYSSFFGFQASQDLMSTVKAKHQKRQADLTILQNDEGILFEQNVIEEATLRAYINVLINREQQEVFEKYCMISKQLNEKTLKYEYLKTLIEEDQLNILQFKQQYETALLNLRQVINVDSGTVFEITDLPVYVNPSLNNVDNHKTAISIDPGINQVKFAIEIAGEDIKLAKKNQWPSISLFYQSTYMWDTLITNEFQYFTGINVSIPILNRKNNQTRVAITKITKDLQRKRLDNLMNNLSDALNLAYLQLENSHCIYYRNKEVLKSQLKNYQKTENLFVKDKITFADYLIIRQRVLNAELNNIQAKYDLILASKLIDFFIGVQL